MSTTKSNKDKLIAKYVFVSVLIYCSEFPWKVTLRVGVVLSKRMEIEEKVTS